MNKDNTEIDLTNFSKEEEIAKFKGAQAKGWTVLIRLYMGSKKTPGGLIIPDESHDNEQYISCSGLVVGKGKAVYLDKRYEESGPWCEIGDWVVFPRHAGYKIFYNGLPLFVVKEDAIDIVVDDPSTVRRDK